MKRVILTGATSMLGVALINECIKNEIEVLAVIRPNSTNNNRPPKSNLVKVVELDLNEIIKLAKHTTEKYDGFYHFGWEATEKENRNNVFLQSANIEYTLLAAKVAKELGCEVFVGAGSQAEYGRVSDIISPNTPVFPETAYGITKYAAGRLSAALCKDLGIRHIWTRIFSIYGMYDNSHTMLMYCIGKLLKDEQPIFTKCEQLWDYLHCEDAARAFRLIGEKGKDQTIYCIGSGEADPLYHYIDTTRNIIDKNLELGIGLLEYAPNQVMHLCADISNLTEDTGFKPHISFEDGISRTVEWFKTKDN